MKKNIKENIKENNDTDDFISIDLRISIHVPDIIFEKTISAKPGCTSRDMENQIDEIMDDVINRIYTNDKEVIAETEKKIRSILLFIPSICSVENNSKEQ